MSKRVAARRSRARWWSGRVTSLLSAGLALACGGSNDDGALFEQMDPTVTGGTTLGAPSATNSNGTATTESIGSSSGGGRSTVDSTSIGGAGSTIGQGGTSAGGSSGDDGMGDAGGNAGSAGSTQTGGAGGLGGVGATGSGGSGNAGGTGGAGGAGGFGDTGGATSGGSGGVGGSNTGAGGTESAGGAGGAVGGAGGASGCGLEFELRPNTVYFALDRSSSMIDDDFWNPVKEGVLDAVAALEHRMRFGFAAFTGQSGLTCPLDLTAAADIGLGNLAGITEVLDPLEPPDPEGVKGETPTAAALAELRAKLALDASPGKVYVLLITDGDPDFCDDAEPVCPSDALVYELQTAYLDGIETRVFNIEGGGATAARIEAFARAGRGLSVRGNSQNIHNTCLTDATWAAKLSVLGGGAGDSLGSYVAVAPAGTYVTLDPTDGLALSTTLVEEAAALLSCFFDLDGGTLAEGEESAVSVELAGDRLEYGAADGWRLHQGQLLELTGAACAAYRSASEPKLDISIDCDMLE